MDRVTREKSAQKIWETALGELQIQVNQANFRTWLEKTVGLDYHNSQFTVGVPNIFISEYLDKKQRSLIEKTLINLTGKEIQVRFNVNGHLPSETNNLKEVNNYFKYSFDTFIIGECNSLAQSAAHEVAQNPGLSYNPLFIYGGSGLGKTHLLQSIGRLAHSRGYRVLYLSGEQYTNDFIKAIREKTISEFRRRYSQIDILLIDDIQFINGKEQTEESFFHLFNELHNANKQIVISSDSAPKSMSQVKEKLRSRLEWGLVTRITPPNIKTRSAILRALFEKQSMEVTPDIIELLAKRRQNNVRELEGLTNRVIAFTRLLKKTPTIELVKQAIEDLAHKNTIEESEINETILDSVAKLFALHKEDLKGRKRDKKTALARQVAMYILRKETNLSLVQIGKFIGNRDHSAVSNACAKISSEIESNSYLKSKICTIEKNLTK